MLHVDHTPDTQCMQNWADSRPGYSGLSNYTCTSIPNTQKIITEGRPRQYVPCDRP